MNDKINYDTCPYCNAEIYKENNSLHVYEITYKCGCNILFAISSGEVIEENKCTDKNNKTNANNYNNIDTLSKDVSYKIAKLKNMTVIEKEECYCKKSIIKGKVTIEGKVYDAYEMTMYWLNNTNDAFHNYYGFNWIPPLEYMSLVKEVRDADYVIKHSCSDSVVNAISNKVQITSGINHNSISEQIRNNMNSSLRNSL